MATSTPARSASAPARRRVRCDPMGDELEHACPVAHEEDVPLPTPRAATRDQSLAGVHRHTRYFIDDAITERAPASMAHGRREVDVAGA